MELEEVILFLVTVRVCVESPQEYQNNKKKKKLVSMTTIQIHTLSSRGKGGLKVTCGTTSGFYLYSSSHVAESDTRACRSGPGPVPVKFSPGPIRSGPMFRVGLARVVAVCLRGVRY